MAFRTDLAREALTHLSGDCPGVRQSTRTLSGFSVDCVEVLDRAASERLGKPRERHAGQQYSLSKRCQTGKTPHRSPFHSLRPDNSGGGDKDNE